MYIARALYPYNEQLHLPDVFFPEKDGFYRSINDKVIDLMEIMQNNSCAVVLGEAGAGKTEYLKNKYLKIPEAERVWVDLKTIANEKSLDDEIFNAEFEEKYNTNNKIHIFLDALDEALLDFNKISYRLLYKLKKYDYNKIVLVLSCRDYYFPKTFKNELKEYFNISENENILYRLLPLKVSDIENYLKQNDILDTETFYKYVSKYNLRAFISKPLTLIPVVNLYKTNRLNGEHSQIFLYLIKSLLEEINVFRQEQSKFCASYKPSMTDEQKLYISSRLAFYLLTKNKSYIYKGKHSDTPDNAIHISEIELGIDELNGEIINLSKCNLSELFLTGLFYTADGYSYSFSHKTYMDFLSAWYIYKQDIPLEEKINVISINGEIIPILAETCGWLSVLDAKFFDEILEKNAHLLLKNDICFNDMQNISLTNHAFPLLASEKISVYDIKIQKIINSEMYEIIRNYINDENETIRLFCIKLIDAGKQYGFEDELYKIANHNTNSTQLKQEALIVLSRIGSEKCKRKLYKKYKDYLSFFDTEGNDPDDTYRASYLFLLSSLNTPPVNKILNLLIKPKQSNYHGRYKFFLAEFVSELDENTILPVLKWAIKEERNWEDTKW